MTLPCVDLASQIFHCSVSSASVPGRRRCTNPRISSTNASLPVVDIVRSTVQASVEVTGTCR